MKQGPRSEGMKGSGRGVSSCDPGLDPVMQASHRSQALRLSQQDSMKVECEVGTLSKDCRHKACHYGLPTCGSLIKAGPKYSVKSLARISQLEGLNGAITRGVQGNYATSYPVADRTGTSRIFHVMP